MLYLAWRHAGRDPYRLYNHLDEAYRPLGGGEPRPPRYPSRARSFEYGCALAAEREEAQMFAAMAGRGM